MGISAWLLRRDRRTVWDCYADTRVVCEEIGSAKAVPPAIIFVGVAWAIIAEASSPFAWLAMRLEGLAD